MIREPILILNQLLFIFLDGVGLGSSDPEVNPFMAAKTPFLRELLGGTFTADLAERLEPTLSFKHLDARLGHDGLPQSATGQTALLTGKNGADIMNGHYGPWPGPTLKAVLDGGSLFSEAVAAGHDVTLANLYPPGFFRALESGKQRENVPVYAARAAGLRLKTLEDYAAHGAVSLDLTGDYPARLNETLETSTARESGERLAQLAARQTFTFFDYWPSDAVGHRGTFTEAVELAEKLDTFLAGVASKLGNVNCLITSDHGNLEDKSVRGHTRAPVPLIVLGKNAQQFAPATSILDVAPTIRKVLKLTASP